MNHSFYSLYPDELLYSAIGRHTEIMGEVSLKQALVDMLGNKNSIPVYSFPCNLEAFISLMPYVNDLTSDYLIQNHTMLPVYAPFVPESRKTEIIQSMKFTNGKGVKHKLGVIAGGICRKYSLYYCPDCARREFEKYGEAYFHRLHQIEGVFVCGEHRKILVPHKKQLAPSRLEFYTIDETDIHEEYAQYMSRAFMDRLCWITKQFNYILSNGLEHINRDILSNIYRNRLAELELCSFTGRIRHIDLVEQFVPFYGEEILNLCESRIDEENEYNWLKVITRKSARTSHPLRHVLLTGFLFCDFETMLNSYIRKRFAKSVLYPCLNPVCSNYKKNVIKEPKIKYDYKSKKTIGTFECECGFIYSRDMNSDKQKVGKILRFGDLWEQRLRELISEGNNISEISRVLMCDKKTVAKYALKLGIADALNTQYTIDDLWKTKRKGLLSSTKDTLNVDERRRTKPLEKDKSDLWVMKDRRTLEQLQAAYNLLNVENRRYRLSKNRLISNTTKQPLLEKKLDRLPLCKEFIETHTESIEDYQIMRINRVCKEMVDNGDYLVRWRIMRDAGLRDDVSERVLRKVDEWIYKFCLNTDIE